MRQYSEQRIIRQIRVIKIYAKKNKIEIEAAFSLWISSGLAAKYGDSIDKIKSGMLSKAS